MRLLPRSLFGRTVLILLGGLVGAQLISAAISLSERDQALFHYSDQQWAQRDAEAVKLMDSVTPAERQRIASILTSPRLFVTLTPQPATQGSPDQQAADFRQMLQGVLGSGHAVRAVVVERTESSGLRGVHSVTEVQLRDGSWVNFDHPRPWHASDRPWRLLAGLAVLLVSVIVLSLLAVRLVTRPLTTLANAAGELGRDIRHAPIPEQGPLEVQRAARAFNEMQAQLVRYVEDRTRLLTAISHDLKTPITRLRLRAELLADETLRAKFVRDLQEMETLANRTLDFLRGLDTAETSQSLDIMALLESVEEDAIETGQDVKLEGKVSHPFKGRPQALRRCLENLVNNAVRYGKCARIFVQENDIDLVIRIRDTGPGIPENELARVFDPFYRLDAARSNVDGNGLGLGIARNIAVLHGGTLELLNHPEGGLEAVLKLPRA
ncbi:MAG TPA: ATP-binding protein [Gammaproteobacteria bacterium]|jgi:signal transduction histidine kinase|nr:ATP-binding protein [Gammaproteobacteria bacterium]